MKQVIAFVLKDKVFLIAFIAAIISMFFVLPSLEYLDYMNPKVLIIMFTLMIAVSGMYEANFFSFIAIHLVSRFFTIRYIALVIIISTFLLGMLVTNDAVLLTLVPFTLYVTKQTNMQKQALLIVILQTFAANLGSALTPMGDPQNIYLFAEYDIPFGQFVWAMLPITLLGFGLILTTTLVLIPNLHCQPIMVSPKVNWKRMGLYLIVFLNALGAVLRIYSVWIALILTLFMTFVFFPRLLKKVDYHLLLTFTMFFIFTGNLGQIEALKTPIQSLLNSSTSVYFTGLGVSQFISNVPAAVLLRTFTEPRFALDLLKGVNVGAMGSIIGSLASLITFKFVLKDFPTQGKVYLQTYTFLSVIYIVFITAVLFLL